MRRIGIVMLVLLISVSINAQKETEDVSIFRSNDLGYADAMNAAARIEAGGIYIKSVHKSVLQGFFRGVWKAAFYRTDKGTFQIVFFPEPKQAEKIKVKETPEGRRFIYTFEGQPEPNPPGDTMNAGYKMYFIGHDNLFIIVDENEKLFEKLKTIF